MKTWNLFKWKSRFNEHEFAEIMALLQSEDEEDFLLGKAILEAKNIKLGKDRLRGLDNREWFFRYDGKELVRYNSPYYINTLNLYGTWEEEWHRRQIAYDKYRRNHRSS